MSIRMNLRPLAIAALLAPCALAQLRWDVVPTPTAPAPRYDHAIAGYGFLFGGRDDNQAFADSWSYEPWGWRPVATTSAPPARHGHALAGRSHWVGQMIYEYLLFGGEHFCGSLDGTTWRFTGSYSTVSGSYPVFTGSWQQLPLAVAPSPRRGHAMAYDWSTATECLLFGGTTTNGVNDETWAYSNNTWQQLATPVRPPARTGHRLLAVLGGFVLCGGNDGMAPLLDCWFFDGTSWQPQANAPFGGSDLKVAWSNRHRHALVSTTAGPGGSLVTHLHERTPAGVWLAQEQSGGLPDRTGAATWDWLQPNVLMLFGGRDARGVVLGDTLRLAPEHLAASDSIGSGCGPGAWGNQGPDLLLPQLILGSTGTIRLYTASPFTLAGLGLQLGIAPAPNPCEITVAPELLLALVTDAQQMAAAELSVPFATALRGLQVSLQALAFEPLAQNGMAISRVGVLSIGD